MQSHTVITAAALQEGMATVGCTPQFHRCESRGDGSFQGFFQQRPLYTGRTLTAHGWDQPSLAGTRNGCTGKNQDTGVWVAHGV